MQWMCLMRSNAGFVIIAFYPATIMLRLFLCLIVLGLLSICQAAANSKQNGVVSLYYFKFTCKELNCNGEIMCMQSAEAKLQQISELAAKSKGNVITLDDSTYSYYATSKPRPYSLVVLLTATHPKFRCGVCKQMDTELAVLAHSYSKSAKNDDDNKVFFVRLDYESSSKIFQSYQVNSVPLVFYLGPQHSGEKAGAEFHVNPRDRYQVPPSPDAESLASFLSDRGNVSVKIERSMIGAYIALLVLFGIILALVQPVINSLPVLLRIIQWKPLWIAVSCGVYTCAISGMIYDIIRSPQM